MWWLPMRESNSRLKVIYFLRRRRRKTNEIDEMTQSWCCWILLNALKCHFWGHLKSVAPKSLKLNPRQTKILQPTHLLCQFKVPKYLVTELPKGHRWGSCASLTPIVTHFRNFGFKITQPRSSRHNSILVCNITIYLHTNSRNWFE